MSNKAYAWLTAIVVVVVILLVLLLPHMSEIIAWWAVIKIILIGLAVLGTAAVIYRYFVDSENPIH